MLRLHGVRFSNYYSLAKAALLEKGVEFEEVKEPPAQSEEFLAKSPMGRVPVLGTDEGFFSESWAIVDYLERVQPEPALLPAEPFARAKAIELSRHIELNVELVAGAAWERRSSAARHPRTRRRKRGRIWPRELPQCSG